MQFLETDYLWKKLVLDSSTGIEKKSLSAKIKITQPQGYKHTIETGHVRVENQKIIVNIKYPMIDDGRFDPSHGNWNGEWEMGLYHFEVTVYNGNKKILAKERGKNGGSWAIKEIALDMLSFLLEKTSKTRNLYVLQCKQFYKIGITSNVNKRLANIQTSNPFPVKLVKVYSYLSDDQNIERRVHVDLKKYRGTGEWFKTDLNIILKTINKHIMYLISFVLTGSNDECSSCNSN